MKSVSANFRLDLHEPPKEANNRTHSLLSFVSWHPQVTLFEQRNFAGRRLDLSSDCARLSDRNFPERCNSVQVESGA